MSTPHGHVGRDMATGESLSPGVKHDGEKPRWDLVPWAQLESVVRVLTFGARKYAPDNWKKIPDPKMRYIAAGLRHLVSRAKGEILDPESGEPHMAHLICCALFLMWHDEQPNHTQELP